MFQNQRQCFLTCASPVQRMGRLWGSVIMVKVFVPMYAYSVCQNQRPFQRTDLSMEKQSFHSRALGHSPQPKIIFPTPTQKGPDSLETLVFVSLITSSDSALWAVWMAYPFSLPGSLSLLLHCEKIMTRNLIWSQC